LIAKLNPAGFEPPTYGLKVTEPSGQYSDFSEAHETDDNLRTLIKGWLAFSPAKRAAILTVVDAPII
jgi:hypothetical protein